MKHLLMIIGLLLLLNHYANACQFDTDCSTGSQCFKQGFQQNGVCVGGQNAGNSNDRRPVYNQQQPTDSYGASCNTNFDCGMGRNCMKTQISISTGTCM